MKIRKIKSLIRRRPLTDEERAARKEAEAVRDHMLEERAKENSGALPRF